MSVTPRMAKILKSPDAITMMNSKEFDDLYSLFQPFERPELTGLFQSVGIEPINFIKGTVLPDYMYFNNSTYKDAIIPKNINMIGRSAFSNSKLNSVDFKESKNLGVIDRSAFEKSSVKIVTLPNSLERLGNFAFYECMMLEEIYLSPNLKMIGKRCFEGCESLKYVYMPKAVGGIEQMAFSDCGLKGGLTIGFNGTMQQFKDMFVNVSSDSFKYSVVDVRCIDGGFTL